MFVRVSPLSIISFLSLPLFFALYTYLILTHMAAIETKQLAKKELRRETRELTLHPVLNQKTSLDSNPWMAEREQIAS